LILEEIQHKNKTLNLSLLQAAVWPALHPPLVVYLLLTAPSPSTAHPPSPQTRNQPLKPPLPSAKTFLPFPQTSPHLPSPKKKKKRSRSPLFLLIFNLQPCLHLHSFPLSLKSNHNSHEPAPHHSLHLTRIHPDAVPHLSQQTHRPPSTSSEPQPPLLPPGEETILSSASTLPATSPISTAAPAAAGDSSKDNWSRRSDQQISSPSPPARPDKSLAAGGPLGHTTDHLKQKRRNKRKRKRKRSVERSRSETEKKRKRRRYENKVKKN